jgi:uncharacterized membrane protein
VTNDIERGQRNALERLISSERLTFFSDAVVAIAMTLLALELPVPEGSGNHEVWDSLGEKFPEYLSFIISFVVIALHWMGHHRVFANVERASTGLVRWNLLWLMMIVITPFATKVLNGEAAFELRFTFYAAVQALAGFFFLLMIFCIDRGRLYGDETPPRSMRAGYVRLGVMTGVFALSIPVAWVTHWAYVIWMLMPVLTMLVMKLSNRATARGTTVS